jgi:hypothetical protein
MITELKQHTTAHVYKTPDGYYQGCIKLWHGDTFIYQDKCLAIRTSALDAQADANRAKAESDELIARYAKYL